MEPYMLIDSANSEKFDQLSLTSLQPYLSVVKAYCWLRNHTANTARTFRSDELAVYARHAFPDSCHSQFSQEMLQQLDNIHAKRMRIVNDNRSILRELHDIDGFLLLLNWGESLFDGCCSPATNGFLDDDCMPGWDTWVRVVSLDESKDTHGLVCWIPSELVPSVNEAIGIDAATCMSWLKHNHVGVLSVVGWGASL